MTLADPSRVPHGTVSLRVALACLVLTAACATPGSGGRTKGGLVPLADLSADRVEAEARPRRVALLVGLDHFSDPFWPDLRWAAKDARDLAAVLMDPEAGAFDSVRVVSDPGAVTADRILEEVRRLGEQAPRPEDTVIVYVSTHGTLAPTAGGELERVLVMHDTRRTNLWGTGLRVADLSEALAALPARRRALVLATCHSGGGKSLLTPEVARALEGLKGPPPSLHAASRASLVLSAADFGQPAREDDRLENDVYTHFLIEALTRGADLDGDGAVSATEAHDYARRRTYAFTGGEQVPSIESIVVGTDPVILAGRITGPSLPVLYSYAAGLEGFEVQVAGRTKGVLPGQVVLDPGRHEVSLVHPHRDEVFVSRVDLSAGDRLPAETLVRRSRPNVSLSVRGGPMGFSGAGPSLGGGWMAGGGLALRHRDLVSPGLDLMADASVHQLRRPVPAVAGFVEQNVQAWRIGAGVAAATETGPFRLWAGPLLSFLHLERHLELPGMDERQRFGTVMPGVAAGTALGFGQQRWETALELQVHYLPLVIDDEVRSTGTWSTTFGVGRRF